MKKLYGLLALLFVLLSPFVQAQNPGDLDLSFVPNNLPAAKSLAIQLDGKILIGGNFYQLMRISTRGELDSDFRPTVNAPIFKILIQNDEKILIGGSFTNYNGSVKGCFFATILK